MGILDFLKRGKGSESQNVVADPPGGGAAGNSPNPSTDTPPVEPTEPSVTPQPTPQSSTAQEPTVSPTGSTESSPTPSDTSGDKPGA